MKIGENKYKIGEELEVKVEVPYWLPIQKGDVGVVTKIIFSKKEVYPYEIYFVDKDCMYSFYENELASV